jgi:Iron-sulfur cluster-binding domain
MAVLDKFCSYPWTFAEVHGDGSIYVCCPGYCGWKALGNIFRDDIDSVWNSAQAQAFRAGILDGSFCECDKKLCPFVIEGNLSSTAEAREQG